MSKIGTINISIPEKVKVALAGNIINIEGYKTAKGKKKNRYYNSIQYHQKPFKAPNR